MDVMRRQLSFGVAAALVGAAVDRGVGAQEAKPADAPLPAHYFFKHPVFEMIAVTSLGRAYHSAGNVGKVLWFTKQIEDGNFESAFIAFKRAGDEAREAAGKSAAKGHRESALTRSLTASATRTVTLS